MSDEFLIWSNDHERWWAPDRRGYTPYIEEAGRYSRAEAEQIVDDATLGGELVHERIGMRGQLVTIVDEWMVPAPESSTEDGGPQ